MAMTIIKGHTTKLDLERIIDECREKTPRCSCKECPCNKHECIESLLETYAEICNQEEKDELMESLIDVINTLQEQ